MTGGDIAGLIAAGVFAVLVGLIAVPLLKLGGVFDQTRDSIKDVSDGITPILAESTVTVQEANKQLARVDAITRNVEEVTGNVTSLVSLFAASVGGPLIRLAGFSAAVRAALLSLRTAKAATDDSPSGRGSTKKSKKSKR
jgi:methyl-accepting chemotaxis protein